MNLEKYKNGNFILTNKHIYAQNRLNQIKSLLLQQIGGASGGVSNPIKGEIEIYENARIFLNEEINKRNENFKNIIDLIKIQSKKYKIEDIDDLIKADDDLNVQFIEFVKPYNLKNYNNDDNDDNIKKQLIQIQKGLYKLQVKIIFQKLKTIEEKTKIPEQKVNITKLLEVINTKIETMNTYIDKKENTLKKSE